MSAFLVVPKIVSMLAPFLGALVIHYADFETLFALALVLFVVSVIPLIPLSSEKTDFQFSFSRAREIYQNNKQFFVPEIIDNLAEDAMVLWSVLIFLKLNSVLQVGGIATVVGIASIFFTLVLGRITDNQDKHTLLRIGTIGVILGWVLNVGIAHFSVDPLLFYIGTIFIAFSLKTFVVPYSTILFNRARKDDAQFLVLREVPNIIGRQLLFVIALLFINHFEYLFLVVALLFIYFVFLNTRKLEQLETN